MSEREREQRMEEFRKGLKWVFDGIDRFEDEILEKLIDRIMRMWVVLILANRNEDLSIEEMQEVYGDFVLERWFDRFEQWKIDSTKKSS